MGPTLIYGKRRAPVRMAGSSSDLVPRLAHAVRAIETAWPEGANNLALLTSRIIPLQARVESSVSAIATGQACRLSIASIAMSST